MTTVNSAWSVHRRRSSGEGNARAGRGARCAAPDHTLVADIDTNQAVVGGRE
jgi:hypothetical protein